MECSRQNLVSLRMLSLVRRAISHKSFVDRKGQTGAKDRIEFGFVDSGGDEGMTDYEGV